MFDVDRFSKFFYLLIRKKILYVYTTKISTSPAMSCYATLWHSKIQKCYGIFTLNVTINMFKSFYARSYVTCHKKYHTNDFI